MRRRHSPGPATWPSGPASTDHVHRDRQPVAGGRPTLTNTVSSAALANNCPVGSTDARCTTTVAILIPGLTITKAANTAIVTAGNIVAYTIMVANTGQSAYTAAAFTDPLTGVLDDATYNNDAATTTGNVSYAAPVLGWNA